MAISPIKFKRGASFPITMNMPSTIAEAAFHGWQVKA